MRKFSGFNVRTLALIGLLAVVAGLSLVNGAPTKPTAWRATLSGGGLNELGGDNILQGGQPGVTIADGTGRCNSIPYSFLQLIVQSPAQLQFGFNPAVPISYYENFGEGTACGFLGGEVCLMDFLNVAQPCEGYESVSLFFSFGGCEDPKANDFRTMDVGSIIKGNLQVQIRPVNSGVGCPDAADLAHCVFGRIHGRYIGTTPQGKAVYDVSIERTGPSAWTIHVATAMDNPDYPINEGGDSKWYETDGLFEEYISCTGPIIGKGGRASYQTDYLFPSFIRGGLNFDIALTK